MKNLLVILFSFVALSLSAQVSHTKTLSDNQELASYSFWDFNLTASDTLAGTQDTATFTVWPNKHGFIDFSWFIDIDSVGSSGDSINFDVTSRYKEFTGESWITDTTYAIDVDGGDVAIKISSRSLKNADTIPNDSKHKARQTQLLISPTSGAGLGSVGDKAIINTVQFKARE